ncbi:hypothetical protein GGX14DRAFT_384284 [Mycena pura]|uniref:Uncharacterized protein n=1 Tax=Mycena pura TaxID=153505 RepID=A0AAD7E5T4_9AGAR|nr:hypothetical protein GGX14DRAFT_384284 [Mycena pura]
MSLPTPVPHTRRRLPPPASRRLPPPPATMRLPLPVPPASRLLHTAYHTPPTPTARRRVGIPAVVSQYSPASISFESLPHGRDEAMAAAIGAAIPGLMPNQPIPAAVAWHGTAFTNVIPRCPMVGSWAAPVHRAGGGSHGRTATGVGGRRRVVGGGRREARDRMQEAGGGARRALDGTHGRWSAGGGRNRWWAAGGGRWAVGGGRREPCGRRHAGGGGRHMVAGGGGRQREAHTGGRRAVSGRRRMAGGGRDGRQEGSSRQSAGETGNRSSSNMVWCPENFYEHRNSKVSILSPKIHIQFHDALKSFAMASLKSFVMPPFQKVA